MWMLTWQRSSAGEALPGVSDPLCACKAGKEKERAWAGSRQQRCRRRWARKQTVLRFAEAVGGLAAPAQSLRGAHTMGVLRGRTGCGERRRGHARPGLAAGARGRRAAGRGLAQHASEVRAARWRPILHEPICPFKKSAMPCMTHTALGALALSFSASAIKSVLQYCTARKFMQLVHTVW